MSTVNPDITEAIEVAASDDLLLRLKEVIESHPAGKIARVSACVCALADEVVTAKMGPQAVISALSAAVAIRLTHDLLREEDA